MPESAPGERPEPDAGRRDLVLGAVCLSLVALIVLDRARILEQFGFRYTDEDQAVLWFTAEDLRHFNVRAPFFFGQSYASWLESLLAVPLLAAGVALRHALPIAATFFSVAPCVLLAGVAWRRRAPLAAAAILTGYLLLTTDYVVASSFPRGLTPGIFLATVGAVVGVCLAPRASALAAFGALGVIGASFNESSLLVTVPAVAYVVFQHWRSWRMWVSLLVGAEIGAAFHFLASSFYAAHPTYDIHPRWPLALGSGQLRESRDHLENYFTAYGFDFLRSPAVPLVLLAIAAVYLIVHRKLPAAVAVLAALALGTLTLSTSKITDGSSSVFFPYFRFFFALPALIALFVVQASGPQRMPRWTARLIAIALLAVALTGYSYRSDHLRSDVLRLAASEVSGRGQEPALTSGLLERCRATGELARQHDVDLVIYVHDRISPYLCGAELYGEVETLFPSYERRTWILEREAELRRGRLIFADADLEFCRNVEPWVPACTLLSQPHRLVLIEFPPESTISLLRRIGLAVRRF